MLTLSLFAKDFETFSSSVKCSARIKVATFLPSQLLGNYIYSEMFREFHEEVNKKRLEILCVIYFESNTLISRNGITNQFKNRSLLDGLLLKSVAETTALVCIVRHSFLLRLILY
jgi:hypothetical protein